MAELGFESRDSASFCILNAALLSVMQGGLTDGVVYYPQLVYRYWALQPCKKKNQMAQVM